MLMWLIILIVFLLVFILSVAYLVCRICKFEFVQKFLKGKKLASYLFAILIVALAAAVLTLTLNITNAFICLMHLVLILLLCDAIFALVEKFFKKDFSVSQTGMVAVCITVVYLLVGAFFAYHVFTTNYIVETEKSVEPLRIVQFADSHIGTTFHAKKFSEQVKKMQSENPDLVLITGDFVDDDTNRDDMFESCKALSLFNAKYGVFFSYGNHDRGYQSEECKGWKNAEFENALKTSGVKILEDEVFSINNDYCIIGRKDLSVQNRFSMEELVGGLDGDTQNAAFKIVLDHQPSDYAAQEKSGVDLVLSGHTHGGQLIPITYVGEWIGANCKTYGHEKRGSTNFIVTSGISDWAIKFKTGCKSEYVVIDVRGD